MIYLCIGIYIKKIYSKGGFHQHHPTPIDSASIPPQQILDHSNRTFKIQNLLYYFTRFRILIYLIYTMMCLKHIVIPTLVKEYQDFRFWRFCCYDLRFSERESMLSLWMLDNVDGNLLGIKILIEIPIQR